MLCRGHNRRATMEMSGSMFVPTFAVIVLLWAGLTDLVVQMTLEHVAMLLAMAGVKFVRPAEDIHHNGTHVEPAVAEQLTA
jgi:hypothetical protein